MVKKKDEGAAAPINQHTFELTGDLCDRYRALLVDPEIDALPFWQEAAQELGFDVDTVDFASDEIPPEGPIAFLAVPVDQPQGDAPAGVDHEAIVADELSGMEKAAQEIELNLGTAVGDLTEGLLEVIKRMQKPFDAHSQQEKRDLLAQLEGISKDIVKGVSEAVASGGLMSIRAIVEKIAIGDKVQITLKLAAMAEDEAADAIQRLYHLQKKTVVITSADAQHMMGKRRELVEPDEPGLPFDPGSDAPADDSDLADLGDDDS